MLNIKYQLIIDGDKYSAGMPAFFIGGRKEARSVGEICWIQ